MTRRLLALAVIAACGNAPTPLFDGDVAPNVITVDGVAYWTTTEPDGLEALWSMELATGEAVQIATDDLGSEPGRHGIAAADGVVYWSHGLRTGSPEFTFVVRGEPGHVELARTPGSIFPFDMFVDGDAQIACDGGRLLRIARDGTAATELALVTTELGFGQLGRELIATRTFLAESCACDRLEVVAIDVDTAAVRSIAKLDHPRTSIAIDPITRTGFGLDPFGKLSRFDLSIDNGVVEASATASERGSFYRLVFTHGALYGVTQDDSSFDNVYPESHLVRISETGDVDVIADGLGYTKLAIDGDTFVIASLHREDTPGFIATVPIE
ncbi:MAG TPA: hypothetical protein VFQ53_39120 [Kofleriaceae bacterium]|nr:hypothetical protein [Kofleriaceae bacterium]